MVESALGSAENTFSYGTGDLFDIAAAYAFHIAESQAFFDGNKRTAIASALTFLAANGLTPDVSMETQDRLYDAMIALATKDLDKAGLAALFREVFS
jgi:death-on-curing protein